MQLFTVGQGKPAWPRHDISWTRRSGLSAGLSYHRPPHHGLLTPYPWRCHPVSNSPPDTGPPQLLQKMMINLCSDPPTKLVPRVSSVIHGWSASIQTSSWGTHPGCSRIWPLPQSSCSRTWWSSRGWSRRRQRSKPPEEDFLTVWHIFKACQAGQSWPCPLVRMYCLTQEMRLVLY